MKCAPAEPQAKLILAGDVDGGEIRLACVAPGPWQWSAGSFDRRHHDHQGFVALRAAQGFEPDRQTNTADVSAACPMKALRLRKKRHSFGVLRLRSMAWPSMR